MTTEPEEETEDIKGIVASKIEPKSGGTFEKQAPKCSIEGYKCVLKPKNFSYSCTNVWIVNIRDTLHDVCTKC